MGKNSACAVAVCAALTAACSSERGSMAEWIYASGSDVYVAGVGAPAASGREPFYLRNGIATTLDGFLAGLENGRCLQLGATTYHRTDGGIDVYVGVENLGNPDPGATYTRNGIASSISLPAVGEVRSVFVRGADVHLAGTYGSLAMGEDARNHYAPETGFVFVDDLRSDLPLGGWPRLHKLVVSETGDVFVAGESDLDAAFYARNGEVHALEYQGTDAGASDVLPHGDDVYVAGWYREQGGNFRACYWRNGVRSDLPGGVMSEAWGIALAGEDLYAVGWYGDYPTASRACLWKNGVLQPLSVR